MKTTLPTYNSCLYPHLSLTTINPHAHENTYSRAGVGHNSNFGIFARERHDYPLPPTWAYRRGYTPYLLETQAISLRAALFTRASLLPRLRVCVGFGGVYILRYNCCRSDETASELLRNKTY